jgi:hypothetical protein
MLFQERPAALATCAAHVAAVVSGEPLRASVVPIRRAKSRVA